jgi:two-component system sensor histidine kinase KdpD
MTVETATLRRWFQEVVPYAEAMAIVGACLALARLAVAPDHLVTVPTLFLAGVIAATLRGGLHPGILAALLSYAAIDYFYVPPVGLIDVSQPIDWVVVILFLATAKLVAYLVNRARLEAAEARQREQVMLLVTDITQKICAANDLDALFQTVTTWLDERLGIEASAILLAKADGSLEVAARTGWLAQSDLDLRSPFQLNLESSKCARSAVLRAAPRLFPLLERDKVVGALCVVPTDQANRLLREENFWLALTSQLALAIGRARLQLETTEAEVHRRSDELKTTLLSLVSHELRTPLSVIKTAATSLSHDGARLSDQARQTLAVAIDQEVDRLNHMVSNLLDLSRIDGGALRLDLAWYDLGELAREAINRLGPVLGDQRVETQIPSEIPPIRLDYLLFDRVLANLILNAVRHAKSAEPILLQIMLADGKVILRVTDRGPGVPDGDLHRIFDRFYRREGPWAGVGLGLALCKAIVEAHGGIIWAEKPADNASGLSIVIAMPAAAPLPTDHSALVTTY